jgi:type IV pilus assembly protein PilZ
MPESDGSERRLGPRLPIELRVEYKKLNTFFADYTKNICKGGTFIRTTKPLPTGTQFVFKLLIPKMKEPLSIRGQVRWVKKEGEPSPPGVPEDHEPGMGILFLYDNDGQRQVIEGAVEKLMIDSLGQLLYSKLIGKERGADRPAGAGPAPEATGGTGDTPDEKP